MTTPSPTLEAAYFDGVSGRARPVRVTLVGRVLHIDGDELALRCDAKQVSWPERTRHGARIAHLRDGGSVHALDSAAWDGWARASGVAESLVVSAQQNWRSTMVAVLVLVALGLVGYRWGVPWASSAALTLLPASADRSIGDLALQSLDGTLLHPTTLGAERQRELRSAFAKAVAHTEPPLANTGYELRFYASPAHDKHRGARHGLGPNAFALPGGVIVVTDEILELLQGRDDVLIGVLGHELGHVRRRHGMRLLVQATLIGTASAIAWGDFSSVLAAAPALLGQNAYSRDFEREADGDAITLLRANGIRPSVMAELFERLQAQRSIDAAAAAASAASASDAPADPASAPASKTPANDGASDLGIAFSSHPADAERMRRFRDADPR